MSEEFDYYELEDTLKPCCYTDDEPGSAAEYDSYENLYALPG